MALEKTTTTSSDGLSAQLLGDESSDRIFSGDGGGDVVSSIEFYLDFDFILTLNGLSLQEANSHLVFIEATG
jgi:hypothetical protein